VNNNPDSIEVKMIDFSNIVELKEDIIRSSDNFTFCGKVARVRKPISHFDYFPYEMLMQFLKGKTDFYMTAKDSQWTLGVIFCEMLTGHHPFRFLHQY